MSEGDCVPPDDAALRGMMLYAVLRAAGGVALRWFYRSVEVAGRDHLSADTPVILVANHPNALVDALAIGSTVRHQVRLTAKGTFFEHPLLGPLFRALGIIPLHRAREAAGADASRNTEAFQAILDVLEGKGTVLIFPEGTTHSNPELVPLRTGAARLALAASDDRGIRGVRIVAVGLVFEDKSRPRSRLLVQFGTPLELDAWLASRSPNDDAHAQHLTAEIDRMLRAVTLNFRTHDEGTGVRRIARLLSDALDPPRPVAHPHPPLTEELALTRRVDVVWRIMGAAGAPAMPRQAIAVGSLASPTPAEIATRAHALLARIERFEQDTAAAGIAVNDVDISLGNTLSARFALREGGFALGTAPLAWWGRLNHWLPFRLAMAMGRRPTLDPEEPAMHTIVWGLVFVLFAYVIQTVVVGWLFGGWWAALYLLSLPVAATWDLHYRDRLSRALARTRTWLRFRRDPALQRRLASELGGLRAQAAEIARLVGTEEPAGLAAARSVVH